MCCADIAVETYMSERLLLRKMNMSFQKFWELWWRAFIKEDMCNEFTKRKCIHSRGNWTNAIYELLGMYSSVDRSEKRFRKLIRASQSHVSSIYLFLFFLAFSCVVFISFFIYCEIAYHCNIVKISLSVCTYVRDNKNESVTIITVSTYNHSIENCEYWAIRNVCELSIGQYIYK